MTSYGTTMTVSRDQHRFVGYAIVSADGFIAGADGQMPDSLKFEADWAYFQDGLRQADIMLIGRVTHEAAPNPNKRRRLVFSSRADGVHEEDEVTFWINPARSDLVGEITRITGQGAHVGVVGGQSVYDWVLSTPGYDAFHLSIAHRIRLGDGRRVFRDAADAEDAATLLEASGMTLARRNWLDREAGLEVLVYERTRAGG